MIKCILVINNNGVVRLSRFYEPVHDPHDHQEPAQQEVIRKIYRQVSRRKDTYCNYLEGTVPQWGDETKLIYRHYATLYFIFACTTSESDLGAAPASLRRVPSDYPRGARGVAATRPRTIRAASGTRRRRAAGARSALPAGILDLIQVFVESLDRSFENVCELDLIFHSDKVHYLLDEIVMGGLVIDTSITTILDATKEQARLHSKSVSLIANATAGKKGRTGSAAAVRNT